MRYITIRIAVAMLLALALAGPARAGCVVEFKAKRDNPLTLYYEVSVMDDPCTKPAIRARLIHLLAKEGKTLLKIVAVRRKKR